MNSLSTVLYLEIDALCIFILIYILIKSFNNIEKRLSWRFFQWAICFVVLSVVSDFIWMMMDGQLIPHHAPLPHLINCLYFILSMLATACWFFYTESELETGFVGTRPFMVLSSAPTVLMVFFLAVNYYNGCLFYFDAEGHYNHGPLNVIVFVLPGIYLVLSVVHPLSRVFKKKYYVGRKSYFNLALFSLITMFFGVFQAFFAGTPLPCIGITIACLLVYMQSQELLVSLDPLTKLNNRYHMVRYLSSKMEHVPEDHSLYLIMVDLDKFKQINDTYGHVEGDHALVRLATVLSAAAGLFKCFVSRYGGDEFMLIYETDNPESLDELFEYIRYSLNESNHLSGKNYTLNISIGYAKYSPEIQYIPEFIALADQSLYQAKQSRAS